eukprot:1183564-Prorocentrum_minimum.AAC.3
MCYERAHLGGVGAQHQHPRGLARHKEGEEDGARRVVLAVVSSSAARHCRRALHRQQHYAGGGLEMARHGLVPPQPGPRVDLAAGALERLVEDAPRVLRAATTAIRVSLHNRRANRKIVSSYGPKECALIHLDVST